ncbi:hypothetical protein JOF48_002318 [Arthrobacter stackebrandtii]|uniref:Uncharacterized protein n=1 Tax=Arthrobacter stackebrandtii TaxID=272161 RepID=A0ABS4YXS8_9MICC|nr:hypothetical protein [Arthrobacter stackebrandtii]
MGRGTGEAPATFIRKDRDFFSWAGVRCGTVDNRLFCRDSRDVQDAVDVPIPIDA